MKKKIIAVISGAVILIIAAGSIYGKSESGHKEGEPDVVGTFSVNRDENITVVANRGHIGDKEAFARELLQMYKDDSFYSTKFSTDRGYATREVPYSGQSIDGEGFMIEDFPDLNCDVEHCVLTKMEQQDIHTVIYQLNSEERMIIYGIFFENKTQTQMAEIMGISRQMLSYKLKSTLNKMREMYMNKFF